MKRFTIPTKPLGQCLSAVEEAAADVALSVERLRAAVRKSVAALRELEETACKVPSPRSDEMRPPSAATAAKPDEQTLVLRAADVVRISGLSRSTLWRLERAGSFPARRRL